MKSYSTKSTFFALIFVFNFIFINSVFAQSISATTTRFVVPINNSFQQTLQSLVDQKIINNTKDLDSDLNNLATITPGAYKISAGMSLSDIINILSKKPYMVWVKIPPGLRKEEIANILTANLMWTKTQKANFLKYTNLKFDYIEGVYFPDNYLIPIGEDPFTTYKRFISKFNEDFAKPLLISNQQGFQWTRVLTLASLVQREAASSDDVSIISGILLNRLDAKIPLGVDATIQYIRGDKNATNTKATTTAYWAPINIADKKINSKYNTYTHAGLPPHPIDSPSLEAINAVLNPATTSCIYYLHDKNAQIHCTDTYAMHLENIQKYLK